ncbi:hypothetical protein FPOA_11614 [Fusarium poae]|uniref:RBR-type E3 ubiquitin transferase n=1 Tax=Fusarium poae TaxID=36050 RepID=A0A1B8AHA0_FUSPO|nr:hypothetical protein FPOA_11614 [Fusarium poae]
MNDTKGIPRLRRSARVLGKRPRTDFEDDGIPAPSSPSVRQATRTIRTGECLACAEEFRLSSMTLAPCSHLFCKPCLRRLVSLAMANEVSFPARCCDKTIPVTYRNGFSKEVVALYQAKRIEFEIPPLERVYCSSQPCAAFIPPARIISGVGHCAHCSTITCVTCKKKSHNGPCGKLEEEDLQSVLELAERTGWKRCGKCGHLIEKSVGCNHMICLCGNDFCYNCGKNSRQSIIAAQMAEDTGEEMDDEMIEEMMAEEVMVDLVAERMDERDWDERPCNHRWNRLLEPSNCQECGKTVQGYNIFVCRACELVACLACRQEH